MLGDCGRCHLVVLPPSESNTVIRWRGLRSSVERQSREPVHYSTLLPSSYPTFQLFSYYPTLLLSSNQATVTATRLPAGGKFAISGSEPRPTLPCITPYIFHTRCISHKAYFIKYVTSAHVYFTMPSQARVGTHPSVNCSKLPFAIP